MRGNSAIRNTGIIGPEKTRQGIIGTQEFMSRKSMCIRIYEIVKIT